MSPNLRPSRRRVACVAIAAAGFLLTMSALAPTYAKGQLVKIPLSIDAATVSTGTAVLLDAAALAKGKLVVDSNVPITVQQRVTAEDPSGSDVVTLQSAVQMVRDDRVGSAGIVNASIDRSTVDRISAIPVEEPIGSIQTVMDKPAEVVAHEGLQFKFPFDTQKRTYPYFDSTLRDSYDANFIAEGEIEGVDVYNFRQEIAPVEIGTEITLPASSWGKPGTSPVSMKRFYGITRELSVEPISGAIVQVQQHYRQYFATSALAPETITIIDVAPELDSQTQHEQIERAVMYRDQIRWGTDYGPAIGGSVGLLLLLGGIYLGWISTRPGPQSLIVPNEKSGDLVAR